MSLDLRTGRPVWLLNSPTIAKHRKLTRDIRAEVLVVGGGVSGALIAQALTNLGKHVTVIDSREIAAGSTMASTAILSYEPDIHLADLIHRVGEVSAVRMYRAGIEAINSLRETINSLDDSCDFRQSLRPLAPSFLEGMNSL